MQSYYERISPPRFRDRVNELRQSDSAVTVLSYILGPDRLLEWAHSVALPQDAELQACVPAIPPSKLRGITAANDVEEFLWTGVVDLATFLKLAERFGPAPLDRNLRVLDFGCGCGRMTRYLGALAGVDAYGVDINPDLVKWCQRNLAAVRTTLTRELPPMPLPDGLFDLVYSLSVFTHLPKERSIEWLSDIARILAPGGILIVTTHGYPALEIIRTSDVHHRMFDLDERSTTELIARLEGERFIFLSYRRDVLKAAKTSSAYGHAFIHREFIDAQWNTAEFDVLEHIPGGLRHWQDIVVLRRR